MGHAKCQRVLLDPERAPRNLALAPFPDPWHMQLERLATHYGHAAVSMLHMLLPLVVRGALRASDFTQDGIHPIYWPRTPRHRQRASPREPRARTRRLPLELRMRALQRACR